MCAKEPYPTEADARDAAKGIGRQLGDSMDFYYCELCDAWHLRTRGKQKRPRRDNTKYPFRYQHKRKSK
jgi:hypothetical protein